MLWNDLGLYIRLTCIYFLWYNQPMKLKKLITFSLFFALSFNVMHDFAFALFDENHCTTTEYVSELEKPSSHHDICDVHYKFHQAIFLPTKEIILPKIELEYTELVSIDESYYFNNPQELFKPPII